MVYQPSPSNVYQKGHDCGISWAEVPKQRNIPWQGGKGWHSLRKYETAHIYLDIYIYICIYMDYCWLWVDAGKGRIASSLIAIIIEPWAFLQHTKMDIECLSPSPHNYSILIRVNWWNVKSHWFLFLLYLKFHYILALLCVIVLVSVIVSWFHT